MNTLEQAEIKGIEVKDDGKIIQQSNALVEQANAFVIKDDMTLAQAVELEKILKAFLDGPGTYHDKEIDMANALHKHLCAKRNAIVDHVKAAWKSLKDRRAKWQAEQEEKRLEEIRKAEEEARRKEAEKQAKIQAKIDEENRKIEEKRREEARIQAEKDAEIARIKNKEKAEAMRIAEENRRREQARIQAETEAKAAAKLDSLQEKKESVYVAPRAVAAPVAPKGASISFTWEPVVERKDLVPDTYKTVDLAMLKKIQTAARGALNIPGVRFVKTAVGATRRAA